MISGKQFSGSARDSGAWEVVSIQLSPFSDGERKLIIH